MKIPVRTLRGNLQRPWRTLLLTGLLLVTHTPAALACGYCIEDKMASVYDHAAVSRALFQKHQVLFFALDGRLSVTTMERQILEKIANSADGVDVGSARVSVETAALSVSINPGRTSFAAVERSLQKKLLLKGLTLQLLRIMDKPAEFLSPTTAPKT